MTRYALPDLSYDYSALEPHISGRIMELHHDVHHRAYVEGANAAIDGLLEARDSQDYSAIATLERAVAFNVSGHVLHSIFWQNLRPGGGGAPQGDLARAIARDFTSFDRFRAQIIRASSTIMGSGWGALVYDPVSRRLGTTQIHDHQSQVTQAGIPLLVIDAWEHAYYLQYESRKGEYFDALFDIFDWQDVGERFEAARAVDLHLEHVTDDQAAAVTH